MAMQQQLKKKDMSQLEFVWQLRTCREANRSLTLDVPFIYKIYFSDYQEIDGGKIMMENNAVCRIIGMGNMNLKLQNREIWEFREVRHVPDLKRTLISLIELELLWRVLRGMEYMSWMGKLLQDCLVSLLSLKKTRPNSSI